jgi:iron complex outermembrane receptor protein
MKEFAGDFRALVRCAALGAASAMALAAAAEGFADEAEMQEIVVTAQKRSQSLEEVPISIQAVTSEDIEKVAAENLGDLAPFVPGLVVSGSPTQPYFSIRGIQTQNFGVGTEPSVGVYIDGIYTARSGAALLLFDDVQQVEVLKGPQGTLFGRNAAAGAISITTNQPTDQLEGMVSARLGDWGERKFEGMLNVPLSDTVALRINGVTNRNDGWQNDAATGKSLNPQDDWATRAALRWAIDSDTKVTLNWMHDQLNQPARWVVDVAPVPPAAPNLFAFLADPGAFLPASPPVPSTFINPFGAPVRNDAVDNHETRHLDDVSLDFTHDFGWATLTSLSDYRYFHTENLEDEDGTNVPYLYFDTNNREKNQQYYEELRLAKSNDLLDWVAGVSYYQEQAEQTTDAHTNTSALDAALWNETKNTPMPFPAFAELDALLAQFGVPLATEGLPWQEELVNRGGRYKSYAAFGDAIWHATDQIDVTIGVRYTHDEKSFTWLVPPPSAPQLALVLRELSAAGVLQTLAASGFPTYLLTSNLVFGPTIGNDPALVGQTIGASNSWSNTSPRVVVDYKFTPKILGYASYTEGYKGGGYNSEEAPIPGAVGVPRFADERVRSYEAGFKAALPEERLRANASLFYYQYLNKQVLNLYQPAAGAAQYVTQSEDDDGKGIDLDATWMPLAGLEFNGQAELIDATVAKPFTPLPGQVPELDGKPTGAPWLSLSVGATYTWDLGSDNALQFNVQHSYISERRCNNSVPDPNNISSCNYDLPFDTNAAQNRTDLRVTWIGHGDTYRVSAFATNLFDNQYVTTPGGLVSTAFGTPVVSISEPRFVGVDLTYRF